MKRAQVIEIEGCDGSGKTTGLEYLVAQLRAKGKKVLETREVGNPHIPLCIELRKLVLSPDSGLSGTSMELIFSAMRIENQKYYASVSDQYDFIVSDRGWMSHLAYTDHNVSEEFTDKFYLGVIDEITTKPNMILYFNVNTGTALKRRIKRGTGMDVIEMKGVEYQEKVRDSFSARLSDLSYQSPETIIMQIDANETIEGVRKQLDGVVDELT